jgi:phosphatidyl-myo-inositol alpha-mannosyltransferase
MKIGLVSPYDWLTPGGVNRHVGRIALEFQTRGHSVRVMAPASGPVADPLVEVMGSPTSVPASGSTARIALNPRLGNRVGEFLRAEQFDVVHVHEPLMPVLPIQVLRHSKAANEHVVNVGTFHARKDGGNRLYEYLRPLLKRWFRELDGKIAVSPPAAQYVGAYFPGFYNIIPNGLDIERFAEPTLEPVAEFDDATINILYVGRAEKRKGLAYLIRAFGVVNARDQNTRLIVVGPDSKQRRGYERSVRESGQRNVHFVGAPSDEELPRYYRTADISCSPALGHESQGYVLLEAMAAGAPVVASNIEGYASVVTHGVDGLLVRPKDPVELANTLTELVRDEQRRRELAAGGRVRVENYAWPRVTQQVLSYYERLRDTQETWEQARARSRLREMMRA